jgi:hypothetical protein
MVKESLESGAEKLFVGRFAFGYVVATRPRKDMDSCVEIGKVVEYPRKLRIDPYVKYRPSGREPTTYVYGKQVLESGNRNADPYSFRKLNAAGGLESGKLAARQFDCTEPLAVRPPGFRKLR